MLEGRHRSRHDQMPLPTARAQQVEPDRILEVGRIEIDDVLNAMRRDVIENLFREITMRIDQPRALATVDVLEEEVSKKRGLAETRLADDIRMLPSIDSAHAEQPGFAPRSCVLRCTCSRP